MTIVNLGFKGEVPTRRDIKLQKKQGQKVATLPDRGSAHSKIWLSYP